MKRSTFLSLIESISEWSGRIFSFSIVVMSLAMIFETITRYVFNSPTIWSHQLATIVFGIYVVMAGAYSSLYDAHVKMDLFYVKFGRRKKAIIDTCTFIFTFSFLLFVLIASVKYGYRSLAELERDNTLWAPYTFPWKAAIPIGTFLLLLQETAKFVRNFCYAMTRRELP